MIYDGSGLRQNTEYRFFSKAGMCLPKMVTNPLKLACVCPSGRVRQTDRAHNPLAPWNQLVSVTAVHTRWLPRCTAVHTRWLPQCTAVHTRWPPGCSTEECQSSHPLQGCCGAEFKIHSAENPELSMFFPLKPGVGQNIALHAPAAANHSAFQNVHYLISFKSIFFFKPSSTIKWHVL